jgi:hypothetical protein
MRGAISPLPRETLIVKNSNHRSAKSIRGRGGRTRFVRCHEALIFDRTGFLKKLKVLTTMVILCLYYHLNDLLVTTDLYTTLGMASAIAEGVFPQQPEPLSSMSCQSDRCWSQFDQRGFPFPRHGSGKLKNGVHRIEHRSIPVLLQNAPASLNRVIFAVIWWILGKTDVDLIMLNKIQEAFHELSAPTVILRAIVQVDKQRLDVGKALFDRLPPIDQTINEAISSHAGGDPREKEIIQCGQENTLTG